MKINLLGCFPPPYGGISIHIKRMREHLLKDKQEVNLYTTNESDLIDIKPTRIRQLLLKIIFMNGVIHSHLTGYWEKIILGFISFFFRKKIVITIHGESLKVDSGRGSKFLKKLYRFSITQIPHIICVNPDIKKEGLKLGIKEEKLSVITPYIAPVKNIKDYEKINLEVWEFIENAHKNGKKVITGNGNIRFFKNEDLYGLDLLIELMHLLKEEGQSVSLIFALLGYEEQSEKERKYFNELITRIKKYNLENDIFIYKTKNTEYYPILDKTDIFIRPTNTDGYPLSLCEALSLKNISIASDVCIREKGTILFKSRDRKSVV